jgi:flagellar motor protein MotB
MLILKHRTHPAPAAQGGGEGGYLASASDLMIGLLFVFIILVVVLALEQQRQAALVKGAGDPRGAVTQAIGQALKDANIQVTIDPVSGVISLPSDLLFGVGESTLSESAYASLAAARKRLEEVLPCYVDSERKRLPAMPCPQNPGKQEIDTIFVEGHTDNRPLNIAGLNNTTLSFNRANAVHKALLESSQMPEYRNKVGQPLFSYSAYGDTRLLKNIPGDDARNRRVDLRIVLSYQPVDDTIKNLSAAGLGK